MASPPTAAPATARPTRALVALPAAPPRGLPFEVRTTLGHPMETGFRRDANGEMVPRQLVTRFEARLDGAMVFTCELHPAISANPYIAFWLRLDQPAMLTLEWTGDAGFAHRETRRLEPA